MTKSLDEYYEELAAMPLTATDKEVATAMIDCYIAARHKNHRGRIHLRLAQDQDLKSDLKMKLPRGFTHWRKSVWILTVDDTNESKAKTLAIDALLQGYAICVSYHQDSSASGFGSIAGWRKREAETRKLWPSARPNSPERIARKGE